VRNLLYLAANLLAAAVISAEPPQPAEALTLQDCIRLAEAAPSAVTIARQERDIAARDLSQARAGFLPQSRLVNGFTYNSPLLYNRQAFSFIPLNGIRESASLFTVTQELDTSGRLRADLARARVGQEVATASVALAQRDLRRAVTSAYYRAVLTRRLVRSAEDALAESRTFAERTRLLVEGGEAARADLIKAAAQVAFLDQSLNAAELEAALAAQELASFWTRDVAAPLSLADSLDDPPPPPEPEPHSAPFLKRLEFTLLDAQRRGFQADARRARSGLLPQVGVVFQYGIDSTAMRIKDRGYAAFVNLTIPVFDWNKTLAAMQAANLRAKQAEAAAAISQRKFSRDYQSALARVKQLFEQIALTRRQAQLAEDDLRLSRIRYEGGEGSSLDVVTAQNQLALARGNHYTAIANYLNARADLEVASGR
jgi:outer membrane protein